MYQEIGEELSLQLTRSVTFTQIRDLLPVSGCVLHGNRNHVDRSLSLCLSLLLTCGRRHHVFLLYELQSICTGGHRLRQTPNAASQNPMSPGTKHFWLRDVSFAHLENTPQQSRSQNKKQLYHTWPAAPWGSAKVTMLWGRYCILL